MIYVRKTIRICIFFAKMFVFVDLFVSLRCDLEKSIPFRYYMKKILLLAALLCCIFTTLVTTGCKQKPNDDFVMDTATVIIDLDSIVLYPFLPWDAMLADLKIHLDEKYADWTIENLDSLTYDEGTQRWKMSVVRGNIQNLYYFADKEGNYLKYVSFLYKGSMPLEPVKDEILRNGFIFKGKMDFPGNDSKECDLYLSPSGALEVQIAGWEDGSWILTFQPTDETDFQYLVKKKKKA